MGKKYIVEIGRLERLYKASVNGNGKPNMTWLSPEVDLTPYTEPDLEQVRMEAYEDGYKTAKVQCNIQAEKDLREVGERHYKKGLSDAWEAARKIQDTGGNLNRWIHNTSASDAIEKIRQYEQRQEEQIRVGDEVATDAGNRATVLYEDPDGTQVFVFKSDGTAAWWTKSALHRTGRNFFEIATFLEKMRGEQDG